jgi:hypothetical protein
MLEPEDEDLMELDCANLNWIDVVQYWDGHDCHELGRMRMPSISRSVRIIALVLPG